jgi:adenylate kinase
MTAELFDLTHISSGDIFREILRSDSPLAGLIRKCIESGGLVPDDITVEVVNDKLGSLKGRGFLLDGFPRNINQAVTLDEKLGKDGKNIDLVIYFELDAQVSATRLSARRHCPNCNANYNTITQPPKNDELCDRCGVKLVQRTDDDYETVRKRFEVYKEQTAPLLEYYKKQNKLFTINADNTAENVFAQIKKVIENVSGIKVR